MREPIIDEDSDFELRQAAIKRMRMQKKKADAEKAKMMKNLTADQII